MRFQRTHPVVRAAVVLGITALVILAGAILLPLKGSTKQPAGHVPGSVYGHGSARSQAVGRNAQP